MKEFLIYWYVIIFDENGGNKEKKLPFWVFYALCFCFSCTTVIHARKKSNFRKYCMKWVRRAKISCWDYFGIVFFMKKKKEVAACISAILLFFVHCNNETYFKISFKRKGNSMSSSLDNLWCLFMNLSRFTHYVLFISLFFFLFLFRELFEYIKCKSLFRLI